MGVLYPSFRQTEFVGRQTRPGGFYLSAVKGRPVLYGALEVPKTPRALLSDCVGSSGSHSDSPPTPPYGPAGVTVGRIARHVSCRLLRGP